MAAEGSLDSSEGEIVMRSHGKEGVGAAAAAAAAPLPVEHRECHRLTSHRRSVLFLAVHRGCTLFAGCSDGSLTVLICASSP